MLPDGRASAPDLDDPRGARAARRAHLGETLAHGAVIARRLLPRAARSTSGCATCPTRSAALIDMRSVTRINQLYGHEELDRLHRRNARFVNTA